MEKYTNSIIEFTLKKGEVYAIPEEDTIFINNEEIYILGNKPFYYFKEGEKIEYSISEKEGNINELYN